jgi:hypothetical protein
MRREERVVSTAEAKDLIRNKKSVYVRHGEKTVNADGSVTFSWDSRWIKTRLVHNNTWVKHYGGSLGITYDGFGGVPYHMVDADGVWTKCQGHEHVLIISKVKQKTENVVHMCCKCKKSIEEDTRCQFFCNTGSACEETVCRPCGINFKGFIFCPPHQKAFYDFTAETLVAKMPDGLKEPLFKKLKTLHEKNLFQERGVDKGKEEKVEDQEEDSGK